MTRFGRAGARILCAGLLVMGLVWQRIEATALGYAVETSREDIARLEGENAQLERKVGRSLSCAQLAKAAGTRLKMMPAPLSSERTLPDSPLQLAPKSFLSHLLAAVWRRARLFSS